MAMTMTMMMVMMKRTKNKNESTFGELRIYVNVFGSNTTCLGPGMGGGPRESKGTVPGDGDVNGWGKILNMSYRRTLGIYLGHFWNYFGGQQ